MSAADHLSPHQFMPVADLANITSWDHPGVRMRDVHERLDPSRVDQIASTLHEGMHHPIQLAYPDDGAGNRLEGEEPWVWDGHHRAAAAIRAGLSHVPVEENTVSGWTKKWYT